MYGWRSRIGVIYPSSGLRDSDFQRLAPPGVSVHLTRVAFENVGTVAAITQMSQLENLLQAARILLHVEPSCITWADTSGSFLFGPEGDLAQVKAIEKETGVPASTTSSACLKAFGRLGVSKVSIASPYLSEVNEKMLEFLKTRGLTVNHMEALELRDSSQIARTTREAVYRLARQAFFDSEALFIPCTDFLDLDLIECLERDLSVPVVAANQATMWDALRLSGIKDVVSGFGRLMTLD